MVRIDLRRFELPLERPLETSQGPIDRRVGYLVSYEHGEHVGLGEATPLPGWTESLEACETALRSAADHAAGDAAASPMGNPGWHGGRPGDPVDRQLARAMDADRPVPAARHGLASAIQDWRARRGSESLSELLSPWSDHDPVTAVPVQATVGDGDPEATTDAAAIASESGFETVKIKVGARSLTADRERLVRVREVLGPGPAIRIDANGAWDRETAARAIEMANEVGAELIEQPLAPDDLTGHAELRGRGVAIALDESLGVVDVSKIVEEGAADALVCKPMAVGGLDRAMHAAKTAHEAGIEPILSTCLDGAIARAGAAHVAAAIPDIGPCGLATGDRFARDLVADRPPVADGTVAVPDGPGLGIDPSTLEPAVFAA